MWYYFNVQNEAGDLGYVYNPKKKYWEELGKTEHTTDHDCTDETFEEFDSELPIQTVPYLG